MSKSLNKVMLIGNVGAEPEVRSTAAGTKLAKVSLATSRSWQGHDDRTHEKTEWHRLTFWDRLADVVERYVHKGDRLYVEGRIEYSTTQADDGTDRYWTDITVRELVMLGSPAGRRDAVRGADEEPGAPGDVPRSGGQQDAPGADEDLPF